MAVTDLTGTTWELKSTLTSPIIGIVGNLLWDINFYLTSSPTSVFNRLEIDKDEDDYNYHELKYYSLGSPYLQVYDFQTNTYLVGSEYKIITFTGGTDVTNQDLIDWLEENAVQQVEPSGGNIHFGNLDIANMYFGNSQISKVYYGDILLYEAGGDVPPDNTILDCNGNVIKASDGYLITTENTLISFTIDGTTYQAESGMTWGEWVNSNYNTNGLYTIVMDTNIGSHHYVSGYCLVDSSYAIVTTSDLIIANEQYTEVGAGAAN